MLPCAQQVVHVLIPLLVGAGIMGSTAVGTSALVMGDKNFKKLSAQVDIDQSYLENSASHLEAQLDSFGVMVFHNCRGLDHFFMRQGGLCIMLRSLLLLCQSVGDN